MKTAYMLVALAAALAFPAHAQVRETAAGVSIDLAGADIRAALQMMAPLLDRPLVWGQVSGTVSIQTPGPVPRAALVGNLRTALGEAGYDLVEVENTYAVRPKNRPQTQVAQPFPPAPSVRGTGGVQLFVIRLRHARAADVAATVNALYGRASAFGEMGRPSTLAGELRDNRDAVYSDPGAAQPPTSRGGGNLQGDVSIVPDARTNSLLIRASQADFELIQAAVTQVDLRPLQVVVQVTIAEVSRNSNLSYALAASVGQQHIPGSGNTTIGGETSPPAGGTGLILRGRGIGGVELSLTLEAEVSRGTATILSRPIIFAANNELAEILVGDQQPFVQLRRSGENNTVDQVVQYKDVGTRLSVLPTISADGYVQLQVTQEVNNATPGTGQLGAPVISTRTVETSLLVRDGQTAVLGGLSQVQRTRSSSGVPFLSDLPVIGALFGSKTRGTDDRELFILLTPRVVRDDAEMDSTVADVRANGGRAGRLSGKPPIILPKRDRRRPAPAPATPPPTARQPETP